MSKEKVPMKIVVPLIVVTWVLSLISSLAIVYMVPSLFPVRSEQLGEGLITSDKIADGNITAADIANGSIVTVKIADGNVTTAKIAEGARAGAISHSVTHSTVATSTNSTSFADMLDMSVDITVTNNSVLIIMWSGQAKIEGTGTLALYVRAMVDGTQANPVTDTLILTHTEYGSHSYIFYNANTSPGTYSVKMQWKVFQNTTTGRVYERTLTVMALPT